MKQGDVTSVANEVEGFVRHQFQVTENDPHFIRSANLWEEGFVDSTGLVEMIAFLEQRFSIVLPDEVLFDPLFNSIEGIASCIVRIMRDEPA